MVAGKMAGYCSKHFMTNCWAVQTKFIAKGDDVDEFIVEPSDRTIEEEIGKLLTTDEATKADMAVALTRLTKEIKEREKIETQLRQSEKRFKDAYDRAEFYKDLFAHDINNLLQGILSPTQLIEVMTKDEKLEASIKKALNIIQEQVDRGSRLVFNVRRLSQLEENNMMMEKVEIVSILKKSIENLKNSFQDKKIEINFDSFDEEIFILGNELIQYVFENILINSVMHNNNPIIKIEIKVSKQTLRNYYNYKIEFIDNGFGIEDSRKNLVFNRVNKDGKNVSGMGLGLSLVKKIIEIFKGKIWVEDRIEGDYSKGSNFIILFPEMI
ncbi:MAG: sensor histidine kinase [Promethearchaeota archaeon]